MEMNYLNSTSESRGCFSLLKGWSYYLMPVTILVLFFVNPQTVFAQNDLNLKVMMGYQGWFNVAGDQSAPNEWRHWFQSQTNPSADQLNIDMWPEMSEYTKQYSTNMSYADGTNAKLFSSHDASTTNLHFKWMKDYNVHGVYLQRFLGEIGDPRFFQMRNNVLQNVINASATYDRHFSIMYDISGVPDDGNLYNKLVTDWEYLVDTYNVTNREGYVKQNGLPVLAIWGIGFRDRGLKPETFEAILNYFHNTAAPQYRAYIVGGVPGQWRTLNGDSESDPRWTNVYHSLDMISPWAVGRYGDDTGADNWKNQKIVPDLADCNSAGVDYMPVIFPGFSWHNMHDLNPDNPLNQIPRRGGDFYWRQAYNAISAGSKFVYVAMFDEVDEATAMFKLAPDKASTPSGTKMVTLDIDGESLPSDWYLRLANETQKMLDQTIPLSPTIPISPNNFSVTGVSVLPSTVSLAINETQQLSATIVPANATNKNVSWSSSNAAVASVNATGLVTGKAVGTASITVTTQDGGKTATATITVTSGTSGNMAPNPIIRNIYTADPSAHVWSDGRLYIYPSHDIEPPQGCDLMDQYHVFSTDDMVNWVDHGEILRASQVPFGRPEGGFMWAPDCAYKNGTYYFYFPHPSGAGAEWNNTWKIGVATSSSPASGFTVQGYIPGLESMIDPCVFTDDDGQTYFYYGGGGVCKGGKMKENMMEIDGSLQTMQGLFDFHEATWVHKKNGIYYLSYSDNNATNGNQMRYATSTSPLGPWTHKGVYIEPTGSPTNHGSIVEYKGQSYAFYHNSAISGHDWLRSVCVDKLYYNPDGSIQKVIQTKQHGTPFGGTARAIPGIIQAEDYDIGGPAISYADNGSTNEGGQYRNDAVDIGVCGEGGFNVGWVTSGEWLEYTVNVANTATYDLSLRVATEQSGTARVEFGGTDKTGTITIPTTGGWQTYSNITKSVSLTAGQQIMRVFISGGAFNINYINVSGGTISAPVVSSAGTATGTVGQSFSYQISASNSPTSYSATGLPGGISVNTSTGLVSGTPTAAGTFNAIVRATNAGGTGSKALTITVNPSTIQHTIPGTMQAESFAAMFGVQTENTADSGGGLNVGFTDANDWLDYNVNVTATGSYDVNFRVASATSGGQMQLRNSAGTLLATAIIPVTGGWQTWTTVNATANLTAGVQTLRLFMVTGGFNVNWVEFVKTITPPVVSSTGTATGTVGSAFNYQITASNSPTSYGATGLPAGLSVNTSTGLINGIPTVAGTFNATVNATNAGGTGSKAVTITISNPVGPTPYGGTAWTIPGTIQAENYDDGGEGVAYHDNEVLNQGGQQRTNQGVDVENTGDASGTYNVGWTNAGEWLKYTVNVATAGIYTLQVRVASPNTNKSFHVEMDGTTIATVAIPNTTGWQTYQTVNVTTSNLSAGIHIMRIVMDTDGFNLNYVSFVPVVSKPVVSSAGTATGTVGQNFSYQITGSNSPTSYGATGLPSGLSVNTSTGLISGTSMIAGTFNATVSAMNAGGTGSKVVVITISPSSNAHAIPGTIQAESFASMFGIQTENTADSGGGMNIGWIDANDWTDYTVNVATAGSYNVNFRVASPNAGGQIQLRNGTGTTLTTVAIPTTGGWQTWTTVNTTVNLTAGVQTLRLFMITGGFNVNWIQFEPTPVGDPAGVITAYRAPGTISVNGSLTESGWNLTRQVSKATIGTFNNTVTFGVLWDNSNLYIGAKVLDAALHSDSPEMWENDAIEIYIDANNNKLTSYDAKDNQFIKQYNRSDLFQKTGVSGIQHGWAAISGGYTIEIAIPWSQLGLTPTDGLNIGFDIGNDDDDNGGVRESQVVWNGTGTNYMNTAAFGRIILSSVSAKVGLTVDDSEDIQEAASLTLIPNPVTDGTVKVHTPDLEGEVMVEIYNMQGTLVFNSILQIENHLFNLNVTGLKAGAYIMRLQNENKVLTEMIIVE